MFDKLRQGKQLLELRSQAKKMQQTLSQITESVERGEYRVKVSADQKIQFIEKDGERLTELEKAINDAFGSVQKKAAQHMLQEEGISGLLGKLGQ